MKSYASYLQERKQAGTLRKLVSLERLGHGRVRVAGTGGGTSLIDFSSNDYLGLSGHPAIIAESTKHLKSHGAGAGASRLMSGNLKLHQRLEKELAKAKGLEAALLFGSGYLANTGVIPALVGRGDVIFADRLNHASIIDGCRLSGARNIRFNHNDTVHLARLLREKRAGFDKALIVVESIYSMDGDCCPLHDLVELKEKYGCQLMVDEAHATGIFGKTGAGMIEEYGVGDSIDVVMGTLGKALGSYGAFVGGSRQLIQYLVNSARTFIYATALPPAVVAASLAALKLVRSNPGIRLELLKKTAFFKQCLQDGGYIYNLGPSQIVPILVGDSRLALNLAEELLAEGILVIAVRPPTVPEGTARLRFSISRHHTETDLKQCAGALLKILAKHQLLGHIPLA